MKATGNHHPAMKAAFKEIERLPKDHCPSCGKPLVNGRCKWVPAHSGSMPDVERAMAILREGRNAVLVGE